MATRVRTKRRGPGGRRAGAGRKPLDPAIKRGELVSVRVTPTLRAQIIKAAAAADQSVSDWMVAAAELAIAAAPNRAQERATA